MNQTLFYWNIEDGNNSLSEYLEFLINSGHKIDNVIITNYAKDKYSTCVNKQERMFVTKATIVTSYATLS